MAHQANDLDVWSVADGRFNVRLNGSGSISLDVGDGEIDLDDMVAGALATALSQAAERQRDLSF